MWRHLSSAITWPKHTEKRAHHHTRKPWLSWWRHQMETFSALLAICAGNSLVPGEFPAQRPVTRSFDVFFDLRLNKRFSKQSRGWWFETLSRSLWRHCDGPQKYRLVGCWMTTWVIYHKLHCMYRPTAGSRFAPSQWETALLCNDVSHWLGASLDSALQILCPHNYNILYA